MTYNEDHGYDSKQAKEYIEKWKSTMDFNSEMHKFVRDEHFKNSTDAENYKKKSVNPDTIRKYNLAKQKIINGLTQFYDGVGEILACESGFVIDPDFLNLCSINAFCKSSAIDNVYHWANAEKQYQQSKGVDLPGSLSRKAAKEKVLRPPTQELVWYGLQFMYRQFEIFKYVPNYDIVAGMWNLVAEQDKSVVSLIDHWFYLHNSKITEKADLNKLYKGYFWRYNAEMTTHCQAETLYILNSLYTFNGSKPLGTMEAAPWCDDAVITTKHSSDRPNIVPHTVDLDKLNALENSPLVGESYSGVKTIPSEPEAAEEFEDKDLSKKIIGKKYKSSKDLRFKIESTEVSRKNKGYKKGKDGTHDQHWDQDSEESHDNGVDLEDLEEYELSRGQGTLFVADGVIKKIKNAKGEWVIRLETSKGKKYKVGMEYPSS